MQTRSNAEVDDGGLLAQAAALAGAVVAIAKHSGRRGTQQEFDALVAGLEEVAVDYPDNPYVQRLLTAATREQITGFAKQYREAPTQKDVNDFKLAALNRCGQAAEWLQANVNAQDAAEVKASILTACRRVAGESNEGGLFDFAADNVDATEQNVLDEVARALRAL
jgi:outer membrane protein OmpA-like peptidoglycan-associated protein